MARARKITNKNGDITAYQLIAYIGYADGKQLTKTKTWKPPTGEGLKASQIEQLAITAAVEFEKSAIDGDNEFDGRTRFSVYAANWMDNAQIAPKTRERYVVLLRRINQAIGHLKLEKIQSRHLEAFYKNLAEDGIKHSGMFATSQKLAAYIDNKKISRGKLSKMANIALATASHACAGKRITVDVAEKICTALDIPLKPMFEIQGGATGGLSDKTIMHHHRLVSAILGKAKKERIINYNVASEHTTPPKLRKKKVAYLDDVQAKQLVSVSLADPDIRKKTAILLCLYSGIRRGEYGGLQWKDIDWHNNMIHIMRTTQWQQGKGIVECPTKNDSSERTIRLPQLIFDLLAEYRQYWLELRNAYGDKWEGDDWIFIQDNGKPQATNTINFWIKQLIAEHDLPHFTPHSLRHTFSTLQIAAGVNVRTLQARTGHSQVSTLTNIYTHAIKSADEAATEALDDILTPKGVKSKPVLEVITKRA